MERTPYGPCSDDCSGYSPRPPLFAVLEYQIGECFFVGVVDEIGRRPAGGLIHPHVQWPIRHERKAPAWFRELMPAYTQVRQKPVHLFEPRFRHGRAQRAE